MKLKTIPPRLRELPSRLRIVSADSWRSGKTTAERGYGGRWQRERLQFLQEHPLCCYCEQQGRVTQATVVDHRTPHRGNQTLFWSRDNWQALCASCHDSVKRAEERTGGKANL